MMRLLRRVRRGEQGASLILVALALVVLLGFAAIAIDIAHRNNQRNEDQAASDTGVMAAALMTSFKTQSQAIDDAEAEAIRITYETIQPGITFADWTTAWESCVDGNKPAEFTITASNNDCVSFTSNLSKIRVRVPIVEVETTFGVVLGVDKIDTSAVAEAEVALNGQIANILPFGLPGDAQGGSEICLKTGPQPQQPPCDGPDNGNFGYLNFTRFGDYLASPVIPTACSFNPEPKIVAQNIAHGVDHGLGTYDPSLPPDDQVPEANIREELESCPTVAPAPNATDTATGNMAKTIEDGFIQGDGGYDGRLTFYDAGSGYAPMTVHNVSGVDDTPLWAYLANGCTMPTDKASMAACLNDPGNNPSFSTAIAYSPRFAWVPRLVQNVFPNGKKVVYFEEFVPVYVQTLYAQCGGSGCADEWNPGESYVMQTNHDFIATSAFLLELDWLPQSVRDMQPGTPNQFVYTLIK